MHGDIRPCVTPQAHTVLKAAWLSLGKEDVMSRIITFLKPCIREPSDYALIVSIISMVAGVLRLVAAL